MKRAILLFVALATVLAFGSAMAITPGSGPAAQAGQWIQVPIKWRVSYQGGLSGTQIVVHDTSFVALSGAANTLDTLADISLKYAFPQLRGNTSSVSAATPGGSGSDTLAIAYICLMPDSTAAGTATLTGIQMAIDGRVASNSVAGNLGAAAGWTFVDSLSFGTAAGVASGNTSIVLPIRSIGIGGSNQRFEFLRVRFAAVTGLLTGRVRAYLRYWQQ